LTKKEIAALIVTQEEVSADSKPIKEEGKAAKNNSAQ
jgi:hypothetical protein